MSPWLEFARPRWRKGLWFALLTLMIPVPVLTREPLSQLGNDHWVWKFQVHESLLTLWAGGHATGFDTFLGVVEGDFIDNLIGLPLLLTSYLAACAFTWSVQRLAHRSSRPMR